MYSDTSLERSSHKVLLAVGNVYEFNSRNHGNLDDKELVQRRQEKKNFAVSAEMALFWGGNADNRIVLTPQEPNPLFLAETRRCLKADITCISPHLETGWVCRDLLSDVRTFETLVALIGRREVTIVAWGATDAYRLLVERLLASGVIVSQVEQPSSGDHWIADFVDSKVGGRAIIETVARNIDGFRSPAGYVCAGRNEAAALAYRIQRRQRRPIVLKSDCGDGGKGVALVTQFSSGNSQAGIDPLAPYLTAMSDDVWLDVQVIVEEAIGGGLTPSAPSFNGRILSDGSVIVAGCGRMKIAGASSYVGIEMGRGVMGNDERLYLEAVGRSIGRHIYELGYAGWYNVDFLRSSSNGTVYGSEINARRTGSTFVIEIGERLFGREWQHRRYIASTERLWLHHSVRSYEDLAPTLSSLNDKYRSDRVGIVPVFTRSLQLDCPYLGYAIYAPDSAAASAFETDLLTRLPLAQQGQRDMCL